MTIVWWKLMEMAKGWARETHLNSHGIGWERERKWVKYGSIFIGPRGNTLHWRRRRPTTWPPKAVSAPRFSQCSASPSIVRMNPGNVQFFIIVILLYQRIQRGWDLRFSWKQSNALDIYIWWVLFLCRLWQGCVCVCVFHSTTRTHSVKSNRKFLYFCKKYHTYHHNNKTIRGVALSKHSQKHIYMSVCVCVKISFN